MSAVVTGRQFDRVTVRCKECNLSQFMAKSGRCGKCHTPYEDGDTPIPQAQQESIKKHAEDVALMETLARSKSYPIDGVIPLVLRFLRSITNRTQRDVADAMKCPRTYVSKLEQGKAFPNLSSIDRLASAFQISTYAFIRLCEELMSASA